MDNIYLDLNRSDVSESEMEGLKNELDVNEDKLMLTKLPVVCSEAEITEIIEVAEKIRSESDVLVVLGVGAIYSGARAGLEMLKPYCDDEGPEILFAGWNACGEFYKDLLKDIKGRAFSVLIMAKGLIAPETELIFSFLKQEMFKKYGRKWGIDRIYAVCAGTFGDLGIEAEREGYYTFTFPEEISTSYAILSAAGLLPLAVAGVDIREIVEGALSHKNDYRNYMSEKVENNSEKNYGLPEISRLAQEYAAARYILARRGKKIEVIEHYENSMAMFVEWLKHLYAGSEGKCEKGIFPTSLSMSNDLLDMGQFLQQGEQMFFETIIDVLKPVSTINTKEEKIPPLVKSMEQINKAIMTGLIRAHRLVGVPIIRIQIPEVSPYYFGQMIYFFTKAVSISAWLNDIEPFEHEALDIFQKELHSLDMEW